MCKFIKKRLMTRLHYMVIIVS